MNIGCKIPGCRRAHRSMGYCQNHYLQMYNFGRIIKVYIGEARMRGEYKKKIKKPCSQCNEVSIALGLCKSHYQTYYKDTYVRPYLKNKIEATP